MGIFGALNGRATEAHVARRGVRQPVSGARVAGAPPEGGERSPRLRDVTQDCLFFGLVVLLSLILYVRGLGFYSDDWWLLGIFSASEDQSLTGLFGALYDSPNVRMRPVQVFQYAALYWLFGLHPLGYHLVNALTLLGGTVLFYLVLRELGQPRVLALAAPLVYALLPHYSTDRFWYASFMANLSMALYFLSLYADLRASRAAGRAGLWGWKLIGLLSLLGSTLAYEVFLPLFFLNPLLVWYRRRQLRGSVVGVLPSRAKVITLGGSTLLALLSVLVFKALTATRIGDLGHKERAVWFVRLVKEAVLVSYNQYGLRLPRVVWRVFRDYPDGAVLAVGGVFGLLIFGYLYHVARQAEMGRAALPSRPHLLRLVALGLVVFGLGYAIFLTNPRQAAATPTGIANRMAVAAALGVALSLVGGIGWVSTFLPSVRWRMRLFCALVALLCTSGFLIINTLAPFWVAAYRQQQRILVDIRRQFPTLPAGSTLILDGACPYVGPAYVFESDWDLTGALRIFYRDPTLRADVVTPDMKVKADGLTTLHATLYHHYPYDEKLFIYHFGRKRTYPLTDARAARRYFEAVNPDYSGGCPRGIEGIGVPVLVY